MIVDAISLKLRAPAQQILFWPEVVKEKEILVVNIGLGIEPGLGGEPVAAPSVLKIDVEAARIAADATCKCGACETSTVRVQRGTPDCLTPADHGPPATAGSVHAVNEV